MSTLKYSDMFKMMKDVAKRFPSEPDPFSFDYLGRHRIAGIDVIESPDVPRYTLPEEVIPGVPWPPGFREEINRWSREFLGTTNVVPPGTSYIIGNRYAVMRPSDVIKLTNLSC